MNSKFQRILYLTHREYEIFQLLGHGLSRLEIARMPGRQRARGTIYAYVDRIRLKLRIASIHQIICLAARYNMSGLKRTAVLPLQAPYKFLRPATPPRQRRPRTNRGGTGDSPVPVSDSLTGSEFNYALRTAHS